MRITVLYQDSDVVVVDKPVGVPVRPDAADPYPGDALRATQAQLGLDYLAPLQRLESEVSGLLPFCTHRDALPAWSAAISAPGTELSFLALVAGAPATPQGAIDAPIVRDPKSAAERYRVAAGHDRRSQPAVTRYRLLESAPGGRYSLLEVIPDSGRSHQARAHLAHLGLPIVGDALYGQAGGAQTPTLGARPDRRPLAMPYQAGPAAPRLCLHAARMAFRHPLLGEGITFAAPPPALFTRLATGLPELRLAMHAGHARSMQRDTTGLAGLIDVALARRAALAADPNTTIYRLINGAGDGFPGLAADRYGPALVVSVYDDKNPRPLSSGLLEKLAEAAGATTVFVRYRQRQASRVDEEDLPTLASATPSLGRSPGEYPAYEDGLTYLVRPAGGWNAGLFPDMRETRGRVRAWAAGKRVLNCFAYTCGFGIAATAGGAAQVVNLDVSRPALERGRANYQANGMAARPQDFLYGDTLDWLPRLARQRQQFDLLVLDPPGFARTKTHIFSAARDYARLVQAAAPLIAPGGLLIACCNVDDLSLDSFRDRVVAGLDEAWRAAEVAASYRAPAIDFPEPPAHESHLKILVARLS